MQDHKQCHEKLFVEFRLSYRVPKDNLYGGLLCELDLSFLYHETGGYYDSEGQLSIDPVVFFKLLLFGYSENINSDRWIIEAASMRPDALYFLQCDIDARIPNFGHYTDERDGFIHNPAKDQYECIRGNAAILSFMGVRTDSKGYQKKTYRSSETVCKTCPYRIACCGKATKFKKIDDSIDKPYYDRMQEKLESNPAYAKRMMRMRSKTVEPVLETLINFTNMRRINTRGIKQAHKHILMAALVYNLKKFMHYMYHHRKTGASKMMVNRSYQAKMSLNLLVCVWDAVWGTIKNETLTMKCV